MAWVKLDDGFLDHPKFADVGGLGVALYVAGLTYCNRTLTDGRIRRGHVARLVDLEGVDPHAIAQRLVDAGLWDATDDGYEVHDYLDHQRSAAEIQETSVKRAAAGRQGGTKRAANAKQVASKAQPEEELEPELEPHTPNPVVEPPPQQPLVAVEASAGADRTDPVVEVFTAWQEATGKRKAVLDDKRRRCIAKALKHYQLDDVLDAVRGIAMHPHNQGQNDRGTEYLDVTVALRDSPNLERFRDYARDGPKPTMRPATPTERSLAVLEEFRTQPKELAR